MYRYLLAGTALATLALPLSAQTSIDTKRTQTVRTSQLKNGAGDDVKVTQNGSIELTSGSGIVVDSDHDATNDGKIIVTNSDGASGIETTGDRQSDIVNNGTITVDETYTPTDVDNDSDPDGPFAVGTDRAGIRVRGNLTGNIVNAGKISVEGNDSAGIRVSGLLDGKLVHNGETNVLGDRTVGVELQDVTGDVRLAGTVTAAGEDAVGARFAGDVGGTLVVQGTIAATGYRTVTPPSDPSKLDADDLLQGGSAIVVEGDVAGGIRFAVPPKDANPNDADEDKDGIEDAKEGSAKVTSYGAAPAVAIGATNRDIAIGALPATGTGFGIIVDGAIAGNGVYAGVDGNGMVIGGRGGNVAIAGGVAVNGSVVATSKDSNATALRFGAGAATPELRNAGSISASGGGSGTTGATAVAIDAGANLPFLRNSGSIKASALAKAGTAAAIVDHSGTLQLVENSGQIEATGAEAGSGRNIAIDLSSVGAGAVVRQTVVASGVTAPAIKGDILFGGGADRLELLDGTAEGDVSFGAGIDRLVLSGDARFAGEASFGGQADELSLAGTARFVGSADFAGGAASVLLSDNALFQGRFIGSDNVAVALDGGVLDLQTPTTLASLSVGSTGVLVATLSKDPAEGSALTVTGNASFDDGAKLRLRLTDIAQAEGTYTVISAGTLTGAADLDSDVTLVPFMYDALLDVDQAAGLVLVDIERKATEELGLSRAQAETYDALYVALAEDDDVAGVFLDITKEEAFRAAVAQTLPDHAGGAFDGLSLGIRTFARRLANPEGPIEREGKLRIVADFAGWDSGKDEGDTAQYDLEGLGFSGGAELATGLGTIGATATWLWNRHDTLADNNVIANAYEGALYWRGTWGAFSGFARGSYSFADFDGARYFTGTSGGETVSRTMDGEWSGNATSFIAGISVEGGSQYFFVRPSVTIDYVRLSEDGYAETGGEALDLTIEERTSDELAVNLGSAVGFDLIGMSRRDTNWLRIEAEGGWREILSGELGATTARFGDGDSFTLTPEQRSSGWFARLRGVGGDASYTIAGELSAEERNERIGYALRASISFSM
ncbi:MAG: autotransporter domain-containing protein [Citromicrobium sp.]|nr:autotransporter domain-containing protein [Citromicrobium sp.]